MRKMIIGAAFLIASLDVGASCSADGTRTQTVTISVEGRTLERWEPNAGEIHRVTLPAGFELGIQIDPADDEKYRELLARHNLRGIDELVKIVLFDMVPSPPVELSTTWGGVNSKQGFGPRGGANGVPQMRDQAELYFHKPVCVTPETLKTKGLASPS